MILLAFLMRDFDCVEADNATYFAFRPQESTDVNEVRKTREDDGGAPPSGPPGTAYDLSGPEDGPAVVLIHGIGLDRSIWDAWMPDIADRYRVLRYDMPGHGESAPLSGPVTLGALSGQLRDLLDGLGIGRAALVGFSLGGMINRRFAIDHPHRVSALAVLNSPHERTQEEQRAVETRAAQTGQGGTEANADATLQRWFTPAFLDSRAEAIDRIRAGIAATDRTSYAQCRGVLAKGVAELIRPDPPIAAPTLVMTAGDDFGSTQAMARGIASEIPGAETIVVPGLRHMGLIENPPVFIAPVSRFLDAVNGPHMEPRPDS